MAAVVRMPKVVAGAGEAALARWLVAPGDTVAAGTPLAEIETDKALVEYAAEEAGTVARLVVPAGATARTGDPIAVLAGPGETGADIDAALGVTAPGVPAPATAPGRRIFASPLVRKIAREHGISLARVEGTGPEGRIVRRDIERFLAGQGAPAPFPGPDPSPGPDPAPFTVPDPAAAAPGPAPFPGPAAAPPAGAAASPAGPRAAAGPAGGDAVIAHTPMRRAIARRMAESKATVPHFYLAAECVVDELLELRARVNETAPVKASVTDMVVMAAAAAYRDVPEANVTWSEQGLIAHAAVDISVAVATADGLVTPVLRDLAPRRLSAIAREAADLARRARERRLRQEELEGGVLTVSNLGMYGTLEFAAIISPPQSAILAVGAARPQPVVRDGTVCAATVMRCTLSADHRAVDGALAARWLAAFTGRIERPLGMLA
jgi:pyruvate dehydrogenase E2 component (dihydrolipoamide acetyltransferase)